MACWLVACLLATWSAQQCWGAIVELSKFHGSPLNTVDVTFERSTPAAEADPSLQVWKRQTGGQPHIDGTHQFPDGYRYGRIYYAGGTSQVIVVLTYDMRDGVSYHSNLYRSSDYGSSFTNINGQVGSGTLYQTYYTNGDTLVYVHSTAAKLYYSNNQGTTFTSVTFSPSTLTPTTVVYHPTRDGWMLMMDTTNDILYMTENYGQSWIKVAENVNIYQWSDGDWDDDDRKVYFTTEDKGNTNVDPNSDTSFNLYTSDYPYSGGPTEFDRNLGNHDGFRVVGRYIFAQRTDSDGTVALYISDQRRPFHKAMIPVPDDHQNYLVAAINDVQALVIVEHKGGFYNLYLSDEAGVYFSLSLRDLVVETGPSFNIDLELIDGLNGTMIANQYTREDTSDPASSIRTVISLDNGGFWEGLLPPDEDVNGNAINCEPPECSLHLHMDTTDYARLGVYSTENAPGIIVAHGTIGETLSENPDLYISRDGGDTWEQTLAGSWGVNLADHGGLMVAAKDYHQEVSTTLKYSCNEGYSWTDFTFITTGLTVFGVITEPGQHTTIVSLYGGPYGTSVSFHWTVVTVDFADIFQRQCADSDYYNWRPWDERTESQCILGSSITIQRRKPQVCCLNGRDYDREFDYRICECSSEDYECDYGFARPDYDFYAPCMRDYTVALDNPCAGGNETYMASTGYRKIAGDVCTGGQEGRYEHFRAPCCGRNTMPPFFPPPTQPVTTPTQPVAVSDEGKSDSMAPLVAVGVLLAVACLVAGAFLVLFVMSSVKYRELRKRYVRVVTAGELSYSASPHTVTPENLASVGGGGDREEEDDKPLIP